MEQGAREEKHAICCMFAVFGKILKPQAQDCQCLANNRYTANSGLTVEEPLTSQGNLSCLLSLTWLVNSILGAPEFQ